jgi:hypothetical protein
MEFSKEEQSVIEKLQALRVPNFDSHVLGELKARIFGELVFDSVPRRPLMPRFVFATAIAAVAVALMVGGVGFATLKSVPGEALYAFKPKAEEVVLMLVRDPAKEAELRARFAAERIRELTVIAERNGDASALKDALHRYEVDLSHVKRVATRVNDSAAIEAVAKNLQQNIESLLEAAKKQLAESGGRPTDLSQRFVDSAEVSIAVLSEVVERLATSSLDNPGELR